MTDINVSSIVAPYQEFIYEIPANGLVKVDYVTDNFVLLEVSANDVLAVNFGGAANETMFTTGIQYKLTQAVDKITLFNRSNALLRVKFALGTGIVRDNRLSLLGTINTSETYKFYQVSQQTFDDEGKISISNNGNKVILQNIGSQNVRVMGENGFVLEAGGTMDVPLSANFDVYGPEGESIVVGVFGNV